MSEVQLWQLERELKLREAELESLQRVSRELQYLGTAPGAASMLAPLSEVGFVSVVVEAPRRVLAPLGGSPALFAWRDVGQAALVAARRMEYVRDEMGVVEQQLTHTVPERRLAQVAASLGGESALVSDALAAGLATRERDNVVDLTFEGVEAEEHEEAMRRDRGAGTARPAVSADVDEVRRGYDVWSAVVDEIAEAEELMEREGLDPRTCDDATLDAFVARVRARAPRAVLSEERRGEGEPEEKEEEMLEGVERRVDEGRRATAAFSGLVVERASPSPIAPAAPQIPQAPTPSPDAPRRSQFRSALRKS